MSAMSAGRSAVLRYFKYCKGAGREGRQADRQREHKEYLP